MALHACPTKRTATPVRIVRSVLSATTAIAMTMTALAGTAILCRPALAQLNAQSPQVQALPHKTFRLIVPFVPGTGLDISTRVIGERVVCGGGRLVAAAAHVQALYDRQVTWVEDQVLAVGRPATVQAARPVTRFARLQRGR